jgi:hypothetical protein
MNTVWLVVGLGIVGAIIAFVRSWQRRDKHSDLGAVSSQWIAEQRQGQGHDPRR